MLMQTCLGAICLEDYLDQSKGQKINLTKELYQIWRCAPRICRGRNKLCSQSGAHVEPYEYRSYRLCRRDERIWKSHAFGSGANEDDQRQRYVR
jgi:hypothetical protein